MQTVNAVLCSNSFTFLQWHDTDACQNMLPVETFSGHTIGFCVISAGFAKMAHKEWNIKLDVPSDFPLKSYTNLNTTATILWVNKILVLRLNEKKAYHWVLKASWGGIPYRKTAFKKVFRWLSLKPNTCNIQVNKIKTNSIAISVNIRDQLKTRAFSVNYCYNKMLRDLAIIFFGTSGIKIRRSFAFTATVFCICMGIFTVKSWKVTIYLHVATNSGEKRRQRPIFFVAMLGTLATASTTRLISSVVKDIIFFFVVRCSWKIRVVVRHVFLPWGIVAPFNSIIVIDL